MKKKLLALGLCVCLALSTAACGSTSSTDTADTQTQTTTEAETSVATEDDAAVEDTAEDVADDTAEVADDVADDTTEAVDDTAVETEDFTLLDVDSSMIYAGLYATGENGEEIVVSTFTAPDESNMISMFVFTADGEGDVYCGSYTDDDIVIYEDENGITWSQASIIDVYTGYNVVITFAELDDYAYIVDLAGNIYEATYLTADETVMYMGVAAAFLEE